MDIINVALTLRKGWGWSEKMSKLREEAKIIATYRIWDIPSTTKLILKAIVDKHPCKPLLVTVWEYK